LTLFENKLITALLLTILVLTGCNYTKRLNKGQYLVEKNTISVKGDKVNTSELDAVLKTQPNRKIFGIPRFHLWLYNIPDTVKMHHKTAKKHARINKRNERKTRKEKKTKPLKKSRKERFGNWIHNSVGEPPILLDSSKVKSSSKNLSNYLFKKGYFNNSVKDSIYLDSTHKKAYLFYLIQTQTAYQIDTFLIISEDKKILKQIKSAASESLVVVGGKLDINQLDAERTRLITYLKDRGYYDINKDFFTFKIDSTLSDHKVKVTMSVAKILRKVPNSDSTYFEDHRRYTVNNIYIYTDYDATEDFSKYDSTHYKEHVFLFRKKPYLKPSNLIQHIYINNGYYYRAKEVEATYKKITSLGVFKSTNISFRHNLIDPTIPVLDCYIKLKPLKKQTYRLEGRGTNRSGNLGISGDLSYRNKNLFKGAEALKITLTGGLEVQQLLSNQDETTVGENVGIGGFNPLNTFNTIEFGPEISLTIPKFLIPFNVIKFSKNASPKTVFKATLNFQQRPDFTRGIQEASLGYEWVHGKYFSHYFSPLSLSAVKINPSEEFKIRLNTIKDPFLKYSYTDHIIIGLNYQMVFDKTLDNPRKDHMYIKWNAEQSGNLTRLGFSLSNAEKDSIGSYEILGIRFAQFVKTDIDFRYKINFNKSSTLVYRTAAGIGVPMANFNEALPFEKSFFVGGSNGLRAFRARSMGPGAFYDTLITFDKIGDILLEGNIEYRFDLLKIIKGAIFYDIGNVWLIKPNPGKPKAEFTNKFYTQFAMGAGVGLRIDLDFFIFRFDFAYPLRQPALPLGERWFFEPKTITNSWIQGFSDRNEIPFSPFKSKVIINIGIGYPF
jgi:outer membrane protein assembly factor BamA